MSNRMSDTQKQKVGKIGEDTACKFLMKHGFEIVDRNYWKKWGEIDIVAKKDNFLHFIEVKSVSHETDFAPEENVHPWKQKRLTRVIQTYLLDKKIPDNIEWQIDVMAVFLDFAKRTAKIRMTENVILG
jgi:putative endonuclease